MKKYLFLLPLFIYFVSCSLESDEKTTQSVRKVGKANVTKENYTEGEILVVIDTAYWNDPIGDSIRRIFSS